MADASLALMRADAAIVGGGPAGLSAALVLGRCRRNVVVFDDGNYRNRDARIVHGFLTRDHEPMSPSDLRALGRRDCAQYPTVSFVEETVVDARHVDGNFVLLTNAHREVQARTVLLATGFRDTMPEIGGARELHGRFVAPCPYCDAWDVRDQPLAAFSHPDDRGARFGLVLARWSNDVIVCSDKRPEISAEQRQRLERRGIRIEPRPLRSVEREGDGVRLVFDEGATVWRRMLFYHLGGQPVSNLPLRIGAKVSDHGSVIVDRRQAASIPGLFVAGDATRDVLQAIVAAGEGSSAAVSINEYLCHME